MSATVIEISLPQAVLRLVISMILGGFIGYNREMYSQPAGLRTHMILVGGSCLAMILSVNMGVAANSDPARLAAQVITGIGFLGAGAIMRYGLNIRGLTSASTIWSMAIVGLAVGYGEIWISVVTTALIFVALTLVTVIEKRFVPAKSLHRITVDAVDKPGVIEAIRAEINQLTGGTSTFDLRKSLKEGHIRIRVTAMIGKDNTMETFASNISSIKGVRALHIE